MSETYLKAPLLNSNDEHVRIVKWHAKIGSALSVGAVIATVETSKTTAELLAETAGYLRWTASYPEDQAPVGAVLAVITDTATGSYTEPQLQSAAPQNAPAQGGITLKAKALARTLNVDLDAVRANASTATVTEEMVRRFAAESQQSRGAITRSGAGLVIVGDGAHARFVCDVAERSRQFVVLGCLSATLEKGRKVGEMTVIGHDDDLPKLREQGVHCALVGVGSSRSGARSNDVRQRIFEQIKRAGMLVPVLVDPDASVATSAVLGEGTLVGARAVVSANARVGRNCLINVGSIVCHDVVIEDHVHVTPGAILAGSVYVGEGSTIGMAATVLDGTRVGRHCLVPNNFRVIRDLPDEAIAPKV